MDRTEAWNIVKERIGRFLHSRVADHNVVEDLRQEVFLKISEKLPQLRNEEKLVAWCYQLTRNVINDHFREQQKERRLKDGFANDAESKHFSNSDQTSELAACLSPMLELLDEPYRSAVKEVDFEGASQKVLSEERNVPYSTLKTQVQRGRQQLKEALEACCVIEHDQYGNIANYRRKGCDCDC